MNQIWSRFIDSELIASIMNGCGIHNRTVERGNSTVGGQSGESHLLSIDGKNFSHLRIHWPFPSASDYLLIYMSILLAMWKKARSVTTEKFCEGSSGKFNDFKLITSWWFRFVDASLVLNINAHLHVHIRWVNVAWQWQMKKFLWSYRKTFV